MEWKKWRRCFDEEEFGSIFYVLKILFNEDFRLSVDFQVKLPKFYKDAIILPQKYINAKRKIHLFFIQLLNTQEIINSAKWKKPIINGLHFFFLRRFSTFESARREILPLRPEGSHIKVVTKTKIEKLVNEESLSDLSQVYNLSRAKFN